MRIFLWKIVFDLGQASRSLRIDKTACLMQRLKSDLGKAECFGSVGKGTFDVLARRGAVDAPRAVNTLDSQIGWLLMRCRPDLRLKCLFTRLRLYVLSLQGMLLSKTRSRTGRFPICPRLELPLARFMSPHYETSIQLWPSQTRRRRFLFRKESCLLLEGISSGTFSGITTFSQWATER